MSAGLRRLGPSRRDRIIQATDVDALASKYSSVCKGYIHDPYIELLVEGIRNDKRNREGFIPKLPLINRGTYVRQHSIDLLLEAFLKNGGCQIISLGGGSDTRPFSLLQRPEFSTDIVIHEIDFQVSTARKVSTIKANEQLHHVIPVKSTDESEIHTTNYHLHAKDLRELNASSPLLPGMDPSLPTLVLSECCLCYLEPGESDGVMDWLVKNFRNGLGMVLYEPIGGNDQFGVVMKENLAMRGISLPTLNKYPTLLSQTNRLQAWGFNGFSKAADMDYIHNNWLDDEDKQRIDNLEFLDEREELDLLLKHYCVAWALTSNTPFHNAWLAFKSNS